MNQSELRSVIERAMAGDTPAFADLYTRFHASTLNLVFRVLGDRDEAEDVCQDVWLQVQRQLPKLHSPLAFSAWLRRIAARAAFRRTGRIRTHGDDAVPLTPMADSMSDPTESLRHKEEASLVWDALAALSPRQRAALYLREVEEYDYRQIAETIDASISSVETLLFRARRSLARTYHSLAESPDARCRQAQAAMASLLDGESGRVERLALRGHALACRACRDDLLRLRDGSRIHTALPLLTFTPVVAMQVSGAAGSAVGLPKLALLLAKAKGQAAPALLATSMAVTSVAVTGIPDFGGERPWGDTVPPPVEVLEARQAASNFVPTMVVAPAGEPEPPAPEDEADAVQTAPPQADHSFDPSLASLPGPGDVLPEDIVSVLEELLGANLEDFTLTAGSQTNEATGVPWPTRDTTEPVEAAAERVRATEGIVKTVGEGDDTDVPDLLP